MSSIGLFTRQRRSDQQFAVHNSDAMAVQSFHPRFGLFVCHSIRIGDERRQNPRVAIIGRPQLLGQLMLNLDLFLMFVECWRSHPGPFDASNKMASSLTED